MADGSFAEGLVGIVLDGRYRLDAVLGEGGMGAVFRAHHLAMDRKVAVKLLKPHLTQDEAALQRFAREARATLKVDSPHAVKVLDFGITPHRDYYMVLEYLDGRTVQRELDVDGPFAPPRVIHIAKQAARALGAAHASGLVHRDVKPDNLLLMRAGDDPDFTKVLDFGVAKLMEGAARTTQSAMSITQTGMVFGTPEFMSPEQACGQALDGRSDLYSLAATMFAMLTGRGMFAADSPLEWLTAHARTPPPHLADGLPELAPLVALDALLQRCLAKRAADRPHTAEALVAELDALDSTAPPSDGAAGRAQVPAVERRAVAPVPVAIADTAAHRPAVASAFSPSTFTPALHVDPPTPTGTAPVPRRGLGMGLAVGAVAVAGVVGLAIVLAATRSRPTSAAPPPRAARTPADAVEIVPVVAADAAVVAGAPPSAADAAIPPESPHGGRARPVGPMPPVSRTAAEVARFLTAAEAAKRSGNRLRWVSEADSALRLDPHNARAELLLAEGLIAYGDLEHGCKYLRELGRNPTALRMVRASCAASP